MFTIVTIDSFSVLATHDGETEQKCVPQSPMVESVDRRRWWPSGRIKQTHTSPVARKQYAGDCSVAPQSRNSLSQSDASLSDHLIMQPSSGVSTQSSMRKMVKYGSRRMRAGDATERIRMNRFNVRQSNNRTPQESYSDSCVYSCGRPTLNTAYTPLNAAHLYPPSRNTAIRFRPSR